MEPGEKLARFGTALGIGASALFGGGGYRAHAQEGERERQQTQYPLPQTCELTDPALRQSLYESFNFQLIPERNYYTHSLYVDLSEDQFSEPLSILDSLITGSNLGELIGLDINQIKIEIVPDIKGLPASQNKGGEYRNPQDEFKYFVRLKAETIQDLESEDLMKRETALESILEEFVHVYQRQNYADMWKRIEEEVDPNTDNLLREVLARTHVLFIKQSLIDQAVPITTGMNTQLPARNGASYTTIYEGSSQRYSRITKTGAAKDFTSNNISAYGMGHMLYRGLESRGLISTPEEFLELYRVMSEQLVSIAKLTPEDTTVKSLIWHSVETMHEKRIIAYDDLIPYVLDLLYNEEGQPLTSPRLLRGTLTMISPSEDGKVLPPPNASYTQPFNALEPMTPTTPIEIEVLSSGVYPHQTIQPGTEIPRNVIFVIKDLPEEGIELVPLEQQDSPRNITELSYDLFEEYQGLRTIIEERNQIGHKIWNIGIVLVPITDLEEDQINQSYGVVANSEGLTYAVYDTNAYNVVPKEILIEQGEFYYPTEEEYIPQPKSLPYELPNGIVLGNTIVTPEILVQIFEGTNESTNIKVDIKQGGNFTSAYSLDDIKLLTGNYEIEAVSISTSTSSDVFGPSSVIPLPPDTEITSTWVKFDAYFQEGDLRHVVYRVVLDAKVNGTSLRYAYSFGEDGEQQVLMLNDAEEGDQIGVCDTEEPPYTFTSIINDFPGMILTSPVGIDSTK